MTAPSYLWCRRSGCLVTRAVDLCVAQWHAYIVDLGALVKNRTAELMTPVKEIRALRRAIDVMDALCRLGACSLAELNRATGLSKSTLRRILLTLEHGHFVRCSLADERYRANVHVPSYEQTYQNPEIARIVDAAQSVLEEMATKIVWPSDITVRDGVYLRIVESNRSITPLHVNRNEIGDRVDMPSTAAGRAYLAHCPERERNELLVEIARYHGTGRALKGFDQILKVTRARGYGERSTVHTGNTDRYPARNDKLAAVAMPIMHRREVACCINLLWPRGIDETLGGAPAMAKILAGYVHKIEQNLAASRSID